MAEDGRPGLIRVVDFEQVSALMTGAGMLLSEGPLLVFSGMTYGLETLLVVGTTAVALASLLLLPLYFRLPARLRRKYEQAVQIDGVDEPHAGQDAARRQLLWRTAAYAGLLTCWLLLIALTFHEVMAPIMLIPPALAHWARSRATADWERANGATLWQRVPGLRGNRGPVFRVPAEGGM
ncbi:hypothetical protein ACWD4J_04315 [Streptomyces sp. NPDC002577]